MQSIGIGNIMQLRYFSIYGNRNSDSMYKFVAEWIPQIHFRAATFSRKVCWRQLEQGFSSFLAVFEDYSKFFRRAFVHRHNFFFWLFFHFVWFHDFFCYYFSILCVISRIFYCTIFPFLGQSVATAPRTNDAEDESLSLKIASDGSLLPEDPSVAHFLSFRYNAPWIQLQMSYPLWYKPSYVNCVKYL